MNKFKLSVFTLATSFVLTACGGGGGGSSGSNANTNQIINNNNQPIYQPATTPVPRALPRKRKFKLGEIDTLKDSGVSALEIDRDALPQGSIKEHSMKLYGKEVGKLTGYNRPYSIAGVIAVVDNAGTAKTILDLAQAPLGKN